MQKPIVKRGEVKKAPKKPQIEEVQDDDSVEMLMYTSVMRELKEEGVHFFDNIDVDEEYLDIPRYIDEVHLDDISRHLNVFTQKRIYIRSLETKYRTLLADANAKLAVEKDRVWKELPTKMSVTEKEIKLYVDERASQVIRQYEIIREKYNATLDTMKSLEDGIFLFSRELTKRGIDMNSFMRSEGRR